MDALWGPVDIARWHETPCLRGRVAVERDVKDGRAAFFLQDADQIGAIHVDLGLPRCAILTTAGESTPVILIQSERAGEKHYIGYRPVTGGNGICVLSELDLLPKPDARFNEYI